MAPYTTSTSSAASSQTAMELACDSQTPMIAANTAASSPVSQSKQARSDVKLAPAPNPALMASEMDNFFGYSSPKKPKPAATKKSSRGQDEMYTHTRSSSNSQGTLTPPPYEVPDHLAPTPKPMTIAKHLFQFGFRESCSFHATNDQTPNSHFSIPSILGNRSLHPLVSPASRPQPRAHHPSQGHRGRVRFSSLSKGGARRGSQNRTRVRPTVPNRRYHLFGASRNSHSRNSRRWRWSVCAQMNALPFYSCFCLVVR
ncbi:hypothetical protein FRC12_020305 [Ceratobasidium sp. 428]|nr:hypothetical protein FRC12_020305 [Ceratobasidium sp. 428]